MKLKLFFEQHSLVTKILVWLGFLTSGYVTWLALAANAISTSSKVVWCCYTIIMESGKAINYVQSVKTKEKKFFVMWVILTLISIASSMTFMIIEDNMSENKTTSSKNIISRLERQLSDKEYEKKVALEENKKITSSLLLEKTDLIKKTDYYNATIKSLQSKITEQNEELQWAINKKYVQTPVRIRKEIAQLQDNLNKTIKARDNLKITLIDKVDINKIDLEINKINSQINNATLSNGKITTGFYALFQFFGLNIHWFEFIFTLIITTTFEVLICMLYSLSRTGEFSLSSSPLPSFRKSKISPTIATNVIKRDDSNIVTARTSKPNSLGLENKGLSVGSYSYEKYDNDVETEPFKTKNPIGFVKPKKDTVSLEKEMPIEQKKENDSKIVGVKNSELERYVESMYENSKVGGFAPGYISISKKTGIQLEKCRKIRAHLEYMKYIETKNKKSIILKPKEDIKF